MHDIEPFFKWRGSYIASEDYLSPFFGKTYSEFHFTNKVYNYFIHPQWDEFGSATLYLKVLYADYHKGYSIIELIGEWNDCLHNDVMFLKREIIDDMREKGLNKFILICENVLNFHHSDDAYYEEWVDDVMEADGWIALLNFREHVLADMQAIDLDSYFVLGGELNEMGWRTFTPEQLCRRVDDCVEHRYGLLG